MRLHGPFTYKFTLEGKVARVNTGIVYCVRITKPGARSSEGGGGQHTFLETIVSQAHFAICLCEKKNTRVKICCGIDQCSLSAALGSGTYIYTGPNSHG